MDLTLQKATNLTPQQREAYSETGIVWYVLRKSPTADHR
jgi:hypothetical protein